MSSDAIASIVSTLGKSITSAASLSHYSNFGILSLFSMSNNDMICGNNRRIILSKVTESVANVKLGPNCK